MSDENHSILAGKATLKISISKANIKYRAGFFIPLIKGASDYAIRVRENEQSYKGRPLGDFYDQIRQDVVATVLMSVAAMESNINEFLFEDENFSILSKSAKDTAAELMDRNSILDKYQNTLGLLDAERFDKGTEANFQHASALIKLRNAITHFKPEWSDEQVFHRKLGKQLNGKFEPSPFFSEDKPLFPERCMSMGCADWAVKTSLRFILAFYEKAKCPPKFNKQFYQELIDRHTPSS